MKIQIEAKTAASALEWFLMAPISEIEAKDQKAARELLGLLRAKLKPETIAHIESTIAQGPEAAP